MTLSNKKYLRLSTGLGLVMALAVVTANYTQAADTKPEDGEVVRGEATIDYNGLNTTINQNSLKAIINWDSFSVGEAGSVVFNQTGADAVTLNRVTGDGVSNILGSITAPGHVFLINRNGI
ncbi:MAG: filamentous hemagglutinin N-terminal domain-containing protein, partial [Sphingomonadales bacterium]|nr:filamentous hemagglutinin N-terminal domain-containing protein [Sphingomonadales bacterium]